MTAAPQPVYGGATVGQLYVSAFKAWPQRMALVADDVALTYAELEKLCYRIVRAYRAAGLARQDTIAFLVGNRGHALAAMIAAQIAGLKVVTLHPMASEQDHQFVMQDASVRALVADASRFLARTQALAAHTPAPIVFTLENADVGQALVQQAAQHDDGEIEAESDPTSITKLAYSGGTTGRSKGILHSHRTTVTMTGYQLAGYEWPADIRFLATTPISHAAGSLILPTLLRGGTAYLMEKYSPQAFLAQVKRHRITATFLVPTQIYGLLDLPARVRADTESLELVLYGAAPIAPVRLNQALEAFGQVFGQLYGQAEAPMAISYLPRADHDPQRPHLLSSCGKVIPGNRVALLDSQHNEVAVGEVGELCVRGPLVMDGYLNRSDENEKVFAGQWLHTGDMARRDAQGYLYLVDRAKDMIISGGFNVYPSEVENCLAQHPAVATSAVIGVPHDKWGEAVTAIVVLREDAHATEAQIIEYVVAHKGVVNAPKAVVFEAELPLTALGKVDKKTIRARYWNTQDRSIA